jgi:hypothetical protein
VVSHYLPRICYDMETQEENIVYQVEVEEFDFLDLPFEISHDLNLGVIWLVRNCIHKNITYALCSYRHGDFELSMHFNRLTRVGDRDRGPRNFTGLNTINNL